MAKRKSIGKKRRLMPGERELEKTELEELWEARGGFLYVRTTKWVKKWMSLLQAPGIPHCGDDVVVFLSGVRNDGKKAFGLCDHFVFRGRKSGIILLDDPDPREMNRINEVIKRYVPRTYAPRFLKRVWDAYLVQTYLHELGHWQHIRVGKKWSEERMEQEAERYAWNWMEKLFRSDVVAGVMGLQWIFQVV